jgi:HPt (histidine-containing phosphotransfer) domain-containing protein
MIDMSRIEELRSDIGEDDFVEVLDIFLDEIAEALLALDPAGPPDRLAADLHSLKGSAQNIGFADFARICLEAEGGTVSPDLKSRLLECLNASKQAISGFQGVAG